MHPKLIKFVKDILWKTQAILWRKILRIEQFEQIIFGQKSVDLIDVYRASLISPTNQGSIREEDDEGDNDDAQQQRQQQQQLQQQQRQQEEEAEERQQEKVEKPKFEIPAKLNAVETKPPVEKVVEQVSVKLNFFLCHRRHALIS